MLFETYLAIVSDEGHSLPRVTGRATKETLFYSHYALESKLILYHINMRMKIYYLIYRVSKNNVVYINKYDENSQKCSAETLVILKSQQLSILMGSENNSLIKIMLVL